MEEVSLAILATGGAGKALMGLLIMAIRSGRWCFAHSYCGCVKLKSSSERKKITDFLWR